MAHATPHSRHVPWCGMCHPIGPAPCSGGVAHATHMGQKWPNWWHMPPKMPFVAHATQKGSPMILYFSVPPGPMPELRGGMQSRVGDYCAHPPGPHRTHVGYIFGRDITLVGGIVNMYNMGGGHPYLDYWVTDRFRIVCFDLLC